MIYIALPPHQTRLLSFYLATEEYVARRLPPGDYFFMWQVEPSVIIGRNQLIDNEVNMEFCRQHGIRLFRRKSGGGCVYADMSNVMFSYITSEQQVGFTFNRYLTMLISMLQRMGVDASATGRNDVMIGDRKVSGNAFYRIPGRSIVHGTMLYDTDMVNMVGSITPSGEKLLTKGILSVRQRIALLKNHTNMTLDEFKDFAKKTLCDTAMELTDTDVLNIEEIEKEYLADSFIYGKNPAYSIVRKRYIKGVGDLEVRMGVKNGIVKDVDLTGDYFLTGDLDSGLLAKLRGVPLDYNAMSRVLPDRIDDIVLNLMKEDFVRLLTT